MNQELGYYFHPARQDEFLGHSRLDINLYEKATDKHFDPQHATFWLVESNGEVAHTKIFHPWRGHKQLRVCVGRVIIVDRKDKVVEAFSWGGDLEIVIHNTHTSCELTSSAPIVHLISSQDIATVLVSEFEATLAQLHAHWGGDDYGFKKQLGTIEPFTLFVAGLVTIKERLEHTTLQALHNNRYRQALHIVNHTIKTIQSEGQWPATPANLADLLG